MSYAIKLRLNFLDIISIENIISIQKFINLDSNYSLKYITLLSDDTYCRKVVSAKHNNINCTTSIGKYIIFVIYVNSSIDPSNERYLQKLNILITKIN